MFTLVGTLWDSVNFVVKVRDASGEITRAKNLLVSLEEKYIINNKGYIKQRQFCHPQRRHSAHGLILRNFKPITFENGRQHVYSFVFEPGMYQLNGANGVGKTTLLKSITIPENYSTMYSGGSISFDDSCVYKANTLREHRAQYVYIGHLTPVPIIELLPSEDARKYPLIAELHQHVAQRNSPHLSEGEQNVISIYRRFTEVKAQDIKLIAIDEALSRIYNGPDKRLRAEVVKFMSDKTKENPQLVVIIVDHQTKIRQALQLLMTRSSIAPA
jgi:ABC-type cobalamin/Fe3+-siderophores transport system ATPase subunit